MQSLIVIDVETTGLDPKTEQIIEVGAVLYSIEHRTIVSAMSTLAARLPWVCSKFDIAWPRSRAGASCVEMALAHGVPVVSAHRALTDCMLIAKTCEAVQNEGHDLGAMIAKALRPKVTVIAETPKPWDMPEAEWTNLKGRLLASGFQFVNERKAWVGRVAKDDIAALGFRVREVSP